MKNFCRCGQKAKQSILKGLFLSLLCLFFASCSTFGDRDNPTDPGADNYVGKTAGGGSSSAAKSSSSATAGVVDPSTVVSGTMTDSRDAQVYKTVTIGTQTWMAENLNYADSAAMPNLKGNSWCYNNSADSCAKYGRLYTWTAAMNIASSYQSASATAVVSTPHQGVCPVGWHIPTDDEWTTLESTVGGSSTAGTQLKSTSGWYASGNGTDTYGFSALPAGYRISIGYFDYVGLYADFWSASESGTDYAYRRILYYISAYMDTYDDDKGSAFSVRCVQDF